MTPTPRDAQPAAAPAGWAALTALPPLTRTCSWCDEPAVVGAPDGWRCPNHPPRPGTRDWGATLNWTPGDHPCPPRRCCCGRCPHYTPLTAR